MSFVDEIIVVLVSVFLSCFLNFSFHIYNQRRHKSAHQRQRWIESLEMQINEISRMGIAYWSLPRQNGDTLLENNIKHAKSEIGELLSNLKRNSPIFADCTADTVKLLRTVTGGQFESACREPDYQRVDTIGQHRRALLRALGDCERR